MFLNKGVVFNVLTPLSNFINNSDKKIYKSLNQIPSEIQHSVTDRSPPGFRCSLDQKFSNYHLVIYRPLFYLRFCSETQEKHTFFQVTSSIRISLLSSYKKISDKLFQQLVLCSPLPPNRSVLSSMVMIFHSFQANKDFLAPNTPPNPPVLAGPTYLPLQSAPGSTEAGA